MPNLFVVMAAILSVSSLLHSQASPDARETQAARDTARFQLYGGYSYQSNTFNGAPGHRQSLNGWDASLAFPYIWRGLRFKAEVTGYRGNNYGAPQNATYITGGFQYDRKIGRETAYGEILAGDVSINQNWGPNAETGYTTSFSTILGGGIDTRISHRFSIRTGGDFVYTNLYLQNQKPSVYRQPEDFPGRPNYFGRVTTGVIWKF